MGNARRSKLVATLAVLVSCGAVLGAGTLAAAAPTTGVSPGSGPYLVDVDGGRPLFVLPVLRPGHVVRRCISVVYRGTGPTGMRLFGRTRGRGLPSRLELTVVRGHLPAGTRFPSCAGFEPDARTYGPGEKGVLYEGTLARYPDTAAGGIPDPRDRWRSGERHAYKFVVKLRGWNGAQGLSARQEFIWQAVR